MAVTLMQATMRWARQRRRGVPLDADRRKAWLDRLRAACGRYWPDIAADTHLRMQSRLRIGAGGRVLAGTVGEPPSERTFWIKWCPGADPAALSCTAQNMRWWRATHPELAAPVPELLDYWADDNVLLMAGCPGRPLGAPSAERHAPVVEKLALWLRAYARGRRSGTPWEQVPSSRAYAQGPDRTCPAGSRAEPAEPDEKSEGSERCRADVVPQLGAHVFQDTDGSLKVSPVPLIEQRLALAASAEDRLIRLGFTDVDGWRAGQNVEGLLATLGGAQPAGFVHGDFKPGNVLVDGADFHVIDWWVAPCISWPLTDVAAFVGNLRLEGTPAAGRLEECFLDAYFGGRCPEVLRLAVNLLATTTALAFIVQQAERGWRRRCWCRTALRRVLAGGVGNDRMQRRSLALCLVDDA